MRIFHYRNLRMFFIPLFGAAVTGRNWNVPGWKKALVSLAGPLPGIALGIFLGVAGIACAAEEREAEQVAPDPGHSWARQRASHSPEEGRS